MEFGTLKITRLCLIGIMVEHNLAKVETRVQFPHEAPMRYSYIGLITSRFQREKVGSTPT